MIKKLRSNTPYDIIKPSPDIAAKLAELRKIFKIDEIKQTGAFFISKHENLFVLKPNLTFGLLSDHKCPTQ